jgi:transcriptional regulator with XRE-family HTH domain
MNVGKSLKIALAQREITQAELAEKIGVSGANLSKTANTATASGTTIDKLAKGLDMSASEFIALGE